MNTTSRAMIIVATGLAAHAASNAEMAGRTVTVCMGNSPNAPVGGARMKTTAIFATIGVKVEWRSSYKCPTDALRISLKESTPENFHPGALAYAQPYDRTNIVVFLDRIVEARGREQRGTVLAYVMAHEITHILQGVCRHSDSGLMKAHWTAVDFQAMSLGRLIFAAQDVDLIYSGLETRNANVALLAKPKDYHGRTTVTEAAR